MPPQIARFIAEYQVPGMRLSDVIAVHSALIATSSRLSIAGERLTFVRGIYLPAAGRWIGLFESGAEQTVGRALKIAQIWSAEVHEAIEFAVSDGTGHTVFDLGGEAR
jgi:hypothetical protein